MASPDRLAAPLERYWWRFTLTHGCYAAFVFNEDGRDTDPDIARLAALVEAAELAVVVEGSSFDARRRKANRVLGRAVEAAALSELRAALRCISGAERRALMTPGEPSIALFAADRDYLAAVTVVGPGWIRSHGLLDGDVALAEPERLARWLAVTVGTGLDGQVS